MKILLVSTTPTHPVNAGNSYWALSQAEYLKKQGHDVYFLYVKMDSARHYENGIDEELCTYWGKRLFVYEQGLIGRIVFTIKCKSREIFFHGKYKCDTLYPRGLGEFVRKLHKQYQFDACIINYYWLTKLFDEVKFPKTAINTHDCFSFKSMHGGKNAWMDTTPNEEAKGLQRCDYIFALQDDEATFFSKLAPLSKVLQVYCFFQFHETPICDTHNLLYISSANPYNVNGLQWFLNDVLPVIKNAVPDIKLIVGGSICKVLTDIHDENVELVGYVDDLQEFFSQGDVVINPCFEGTGLKIKTFEGVSWGKVVMAHPHSAEGIFKKEEAPIYVSNVPGQWKDHLVEVFNNSSLRKSIKERDRQYIAQMNQFIAQEYASFLSTGNS